MTEIETLEKQKAIDVRIMDVIRTINAHIINDFGDPHHKQSIIEDRTTISTEENILLKEYTALIELKKMLENELSTILLIKDKPSNEAIHKKYTTLFADLTLFIRNLHEYTTNIKTLREEISTDTAKDKKIKIITHEYDVSEEIYTQIMKVQKKVILALEIIEASLPEKQ